MIVNSSTSLREPTDGQSVNRKPPADEPKYLPFILRLHQILLRSRGNAVSSMHTHNLAGAGSVQVRPPAALESLPHVPGPTIYNCTNLIVL